MMVKNQKYKITCLDNFWFGDNEKNLAMQLSSDDNTNTLIDGFLAHEVSSLIPEATYGVKDELEVWKNNEELPEGVSVGDNKLDDDGNTIPKYNTIDHSKLVPLLTKALQEQQATIEALTARITALENA